MQVYNFYGDVVKKSTINKHEALRKMKSNNLLLIDNLSFSYHKEWINIFGIERPYYEEGNDKTHPLYKPYIPGHIYIIRSKKTGKAYIGETSNIIQRKSTHLSDLRNLNHVNADMQVDAILFGLNNFTFGIIEFGVIAEKLLSREKIWIKYFNTEFPNGYNCPYDDKLDYRERVSRDFIKDLLVMKDFGEGDIQDGIQINKNIETKIKKGIDYYRGIK